MSPLDPPDYDVNKCKQCMPKLDTTTKSIIGDYRNSVNVKNTDVPDFDDKYIKEQLSYNFDLKDIDIDEYKEVAVSDKNRPDMDDAPNSDVDSTAFEKFLGVYVMLPGDDGESKVLARVKDLKRDHDGSLIGKTHSKPILNTSVYNVETPNGNLQEYTANVIAENLWKHVDDDSYNDENLYEIIGHRKNDDAIDEANGFYETKTGAKRRVIRKKVWDLQIKWHQEILHLLH